MLDDFFFRALAAGLMIAAISGPLGCFVIWRRMAYFGDTLAHAALLGFSINLLTDLPIGLSVLVVSMGIAVTLVLLNAKVSLSFDALLGLIAHSMLAIGLVVLSIIATRPIDVMSFLVGDILSVSRSDLAIILVAVLAISATLYLFWEKLFAFTVNSDLYQAEFGNRLRIELLLVVMIACLIALSIKVIGVLLITSLLIIPAAAARAVSNTPERMAGLASLFGIVSVVGGLWSSLHWDTPSGPSIVVASCVIFVVSQIASQLMFRKTS